MKVILDMYCGCGGISSGIYRIYKNSVEIYGVDIEQQPNYQFNFIRTDSQSFLSNLNSKGFFLYYNKKIYLKDILWITSSPPCQRYSFAAAKHRNKGKFYPDLVEITRKLLLESGKPYLIENVVQAPLINPIYIEGPQVGLIPRMENGTYIPGILKKRKFESNVNLKSPPKIGRPGFKTKKGCVKNGDYVTIAGHGGDSIKGLGTLEIWKKATEIDWLKFGSAKEQKHEMAEAIPPRYSEFISKQMVEKIK